MQVTNMEILISYYKKFIEIFTVHVGGIYGINTSKAYFEYTNFYLVIER